MLGVIMLFPIKPVTEEHRSSERERILREGQEISSNCYYMKQTVGNACGTVGILHCLANARHQFATRSNSFLAKFFESTATLSPDERATWLEEDEEIEQNHVTAAEAGQSEQPTTDVDTHFVCFRFVLQYLFFLFLCVSVCKVLSYLIVMSAVISMDISMN